MPPNSLVGTLGEGISGNVGALAATSGRQFQAALTAQGKVGGAMAIGLFFALAAQGEDGGGAAKLALLGSRFGLRRAKLGGGQPCLLCSCCLACACWHCWCQKRRDLTINMRWKGLRGSGGGGITKGRSRVVAVMRGGKLGGGSGACFARVAWLALVGVCGV